MQDDVIEEDAPLDEEKEEEETPTKLKQLKAQAAKIAKTIIPQKGGRLWRVYQRRVNGIHVYSGIDPAIYEPYMSTFTFLGLSQSDLVKMINLFIKIDSDKSGSISIFEYLMAVDIDRTAFSLKIFSIFDSDESDDVDFVEFVLAMWNFCSLSADELCAFAFRCFATKRGKTWELGLEDCEVLVDAIYGNQQCKERRITTSYLNSRIQKNGHFPFAQWKEWTRHNARAIFPIFDIQRRMRRRCLGNSFWKNQAKQRVIKFGNMDWTQIERRLECAAMIRKRRVIHMRKRDYKYLDDMDASTLQTTPSLENNNNSDDGDGVNDANSWTAPDNQILPQLTTRRRRSLDENAQNQPDSTFRSAKKPTKRTVKKFQLVEEHGYQQLVPLISQQALPNEFNNTLEKSKDNIPLFLPDTGILIEDMKPKAKRMKPIPINVPIHIKHKPFKPPRRSRSEAIAILKKLRNPPPYEPQTSSDDNFKPVVGCTNHRRWLASGRAVSRFIQSAPPAERLGFQHVHLLAEPSALERACGISSLGHLALSPNAEEITSLNNNHDEDHSSSFTKEKGRGA